VLSGFTPINNSRKQNPVPPPIRTEPRTPSITASDTEELFPPDWGTIQSDSEPNDQDPDAGPAIGPGRGPLAAVSTASSSRTSASPEALYRQPYFPFVLPQQHPSVLSKETLPRRPQYIGPGQVQSARLSQKHPLLFHKHPPVLHRGLKHRRPLHSITDTPASYQSLLLQARPDL
jgi:hypothetical protein